MNVKFRSVIHCCWLDNDSIQETYQKMQRAYGTHCPSESLVRKWFKEFEDGRIDVYDLPRSGRPKLFEKVDEVKKVIDEFPFASCRYIAHIINIDKNTVKRILIEDLHMKKVLFRWVPNNLTESQKKMRVELSAQLLSLLNSFSMNQIKKVITADESWFFLYYTIDGMWRYGGIRPTKQKHKIQDEKVMIFTAFSIKGLVMINILPKNTTFTAEYFCTNILPQLKLATDSMKGVSTSVKIRLHMDNARPHNAKLSEEKMEELHIERLPHPPYSPDISPNDFFLYGYIKYKLKGRMFDSRESLIKAIEEIVQEIDENRWKSVYDEWIQRLQQVIKNNGEYLSK